MPRVVFKGRGVTPPPVWPSKTADPRCGSQQTSGGVTVDAERGVSVLDAALRAGVQLYHTCGGNASCSTCRVLVLRGAENLSPIGDAESQILDSFDLKSPYRLGCQAEVLKGEVEVEIPKRAKEPRPNKTPPVP